MQEIVKIELIISDQDNKEYEDFKLQHHRLLDLIDKMVHDGLKHLLY